MATPCHLDVVSLVDERDLTQRRADRPAPACGSLLHGLSPAAWTPEQEADSVPAQLSRICRDCPVARECLLEAVRMDDVGYRAGTTTRERRRLFADFRTPRQEVELDPDRRRPRHTRGEGSLASYRRGCRCDECRSHNAAARRRERARAS